MAKTHKPAAKITDLVPDMHNANLGTERGRGMIEKALRSVGAGRSIVVDKQGQVIAGNKTLEVWAEMSDAIEVVHTNGQRLVVVQRDDLDLSDDPTGAARQLAYWDNRTSEVNLAWHVEQIAADLSANLDFGGIFRPDELTKAQEYLAALTPADRLSTYAPGFAQETVTENDIAQTQNKLADQFAHKQAEMTEVLCPECGHQFYLNTRDL